MMEVEIDTAPGTDGHPTVGGGRTRSTPVPTEMNRQALVTGRRRGSQPVRSSNREENTADGDRGERRSRSGSRGRRRGRRRPQETRGRVVQTVEPSNEQRRGVTTNEQRETTTMGGVGGSTNTTQDSPSSHNIPAGDGGGGWQEIDWEEEDDVPLRRRVYCPVEGCPLANPFRAAGWLSRDAVRRHLQAHADGYAQGQIPRAFMLANSLGQCSVCQKILHIRFGNCCPSCRPLQAERQTNTTTNRPIPSYIPNFETASTTKITTKKGIPFGARKEWAECLDVALGEVLRHNNERAWAELWAFPKMVLRAPDRGARIGKKPQKTQDKDVRYGLIATETACSKSTSPVTTMRGLHKTKKKRKRRGSKKLLTS